MCTRHAKKWQGSGTEGEEEECYGCMAVTGKSSQSCGTVRQPPVLVHLAPEVAQWPWSPGHVGDRSWDTANAGVTPFGLLGCMALDSNVGLLLGTVVAATIAGGVQVGTPNL
jgi:hypothetical protein